MGFLENSKDNALMGVMKSARYLQFVKIHKYDRYFLLKRNILRVLPFVVPIMSILNLVVVFRSGKKYIFDDVMESVVMSFCISAAGAAPLYFVFIDDFIEELAEQISKFPFGKPPGLDNKIRLSDIMTKTALGYCALMSFCYCANGMIVQKQCERINSEQGIGRVCGMPMVIMFVDKMHWTFKLILSMMFFASLALATLSPVGMLAVGVMSFEVNLSKLDHLTVLLQKFKQKQTHQERHNLVMHCIKYHIHTIESFGFATDKFKKLVFFYMTLSSMTMALIGIQILNVETKVLFIIAHFIGWCFGMLIMCYIGQRTIDKSESMAFEFYDIPWYEKEFLPFRGHIQFMIMRAQKPIVVESYVGVSPSLSAYSDLMSSTYSYMTMLSTTKHDS